MGQMRACTYKCSHGLSGIAILIQVCTIMASFDRKFLFFVIGFPLAEVFANKRIAQGREMQGKVGIVS